MWPPSQSWTLIAASNIASSTFLKTPVAYPPGFCFEVKFSHATQRWFFPLDHGRGFGWLQPRSYIHTSAYAIFHTTT